MWKILTLSKFVFEVSFQVKKYAKVELFSEKKLLKNQ